MTYNELLEGYKAGTLEPDQLSEIERDIERHRAISEYLFDEELETARESLPDSGASDELETVDLDFKKLVEGRVQNSILKTSAVVAFAIVIFALMANYAITHPVNQDVYDPTVIAYYDNATAGNVTEFEMGLYAYAELFKPFSQVDSVYVEPSDRGSYQFIAYSYTNEIGRRPDLASGVIKNGKLSWNNSASLENQINTFAWNNRDYGILRPLSSQLPKEEVITKSVQKEEISVLSAYERYRVYITFDNILDYEDALELCKEYEMTNVWLPIRCDQSNSILLGIRPFGHIPAHDQVMINGSNSYPCFWGYNDVNADNASEHLENQNLAKQHILSEIRYLKNYTQFPLKNNYSLEELEQAEAYIQNNLNKNILKVYGCVTELTKEEMLELLQDERVYYISLEK